MPTVSVIIPTYNRANYICEAIDSILAQTYADYEIIVVDDGSTDGTRQALQRWIDDGTICYYYQENRGESAARNHGIRKARGQYIAFLDSDDLFLPTKFEKQVACLS
jgi:glycosyltransferase involved in cell wall biosynthesis